MIDPSLSLAALFPDRRVVVIWGMARDWADFSALTARELAAISRAVEARRLEYAATRCMARRAIAELGFGGPMTELLNHADRSPIWPNGVVGALTHSGGFCAVAVARRTHYRGLGLDAECGLPSPEVEPRILTQSELAWLALFAPADRARFCKVLFSAKESVFKAQFPVFKRQLEFCDVELSAAGPDRLCALLRQDGRAKAALQFEVRFATEGDLVATATALPEQPDAR
jgi:4'-phosphopantetheinyl transferase EntD